MPTTYTVKRGDNLSVIARRHGLRSWRTIYDHPDNEGFKRMRPNPNLIYPGDVLIIPDAPTPPTSGKTHPALRPGVPQARIVDDKCCMLATDIECPYTGSKSAYTCSTGYIKHHWVCTEGQRRIGCGECAKSPSSSCWVGPFECSIWWWM